MPIEGRHFEARVEDGDWIIRAKESEEVAADPCWLASTAEEEIERLDAEREAELFTEEED